MLYEEERKAFGKISRRGGVLVWLLLLDGLLSFKDRVLFLHLSPRQGAISQILNHPRQLSDLQYDCVISTKQICKYYAVHSLYYVH